MAAVVEDREQQRSGEYPKTGFLLHHFFVKSIPSFVLIKKQGNAIEQQCHSWTVRGMVGSATYHRLLDRGRLQPRPHFLESGQSPSLSRDWLACLISSAPRDHGQIVHGVSGLFLSAKRHSNAGSESV
jgi:hypothetical protein